MVLEPTVCAVQERVYMQSTGCVVLASDSAVPCDRNKRPASLDASLWRISCSRFNFRPDLSCERLICLRWVPTNAVRDSRCHYQVSSWRLTHLRTGLCKQLSQNELSCGTHHLIGCCVRTKRLYYVIELSYVMYLLHPPPQVSPLIWNIEYVKINNME